MLISWTVILSSCLIWQIISFIVPPNENGCVYASLSGPAIDLQKMPILAKKIVFSDEAHFEFGGYVNKQTLSHLGHRKPARILWKADAPKTRDCLVQILVQRSSKMSKERPLLVIVPCWTNFWSQKLKRRILAIFGFNGTALRATQPKLHSMVGRPVFEDRIISCRADVVWPPRNINFIGILFVGWRQRLVLRRQAWDNWRFKEQFSWSHWWNTATRNR